MNPSKMANRLTSTASLLFFLISPAIAQDEDDPGGPEQADQGVTIQLPTLGVSVDAAGILMARVFTDRGGQLMAERVRAAKQNVAADLQKKARLRKVSLRRLEAAIQQRLESGQKLTDAMRYLAGLQRAEYLFVLPEQADIVIAGPAEAWVQNPSGRVVGISSGRPAMMLEDLLAALRTFPPSSRANTWVGCSINPTAIGIRNLREFQKKIPARVPAGSRDRLTSNLAQGLQQSLGMASIEIYGIPRRTHLAQVMVEADYRMKMIAVGLEPPPVTRLTTFIAALKGAPRDMQRWWLSPDYDCVRETPDKLSIQLVGRGVKLATENIDFGPRAVVNQKPRKPSRAARAYASSFTDNYEAISNVRPVFAQLRNVIDLLVVSAWALSRGAYERANWIPDLLLDEARLPINAMPDPRQAPCVANAVWKGNVLILPAGGGVSILASKALQPKHLMRDDDGEIKKVTDSIQIPAADRWWWD